MEELKEKSLNPEIDSKIEAAGNSTAFADLDENVRLAIHCAAEKKAIGTTVLDLRAIASFTEFFAITSGANQRQVQAIADEIEEKLKKELKCRPVRIEGYKTAEWILMDYGDFIFHIFEQKAREFYDLERLWRDAGKVTLPEEL
jgi:ribosome-associated protein